MVADCSCRGVLAVVSPWTLQILGRMSRRGLRVLYWPNAEQSGGGGPIKYNPAAYLESSVITYYTLGVSISDRRASTIINSRKAV